MLTHSHQAQKVPISWAQSCPRHFFDVFDVRLVGSARKHSVFLHSPRSLLPNPLLGFSTPFNAHSKNKKTPGGVFFVFSSGKRVCCQSGTASRLIANPTGSMLVGSHQAQKVPISWTLRAHGTFYRTLFSGSRHLSIPSLNKKDTIKVSFSFRAGKGSRTLDIDLGKVALYQLSYSRECSKFNKK